MEYCRHNFYYSLYWFNHSWFMLC